MVKGEFNPERLNSLRRDDRYPEILKWLRDQLNSLTRSCLTAQDREAAEQYRVRARTYSEVYDYLSRDPE